MGASMVWENSCASHLTLTYSLAAAGWGNALSCFYSCSFRGVFEVTYLTLGAGRSFQEPSQLMAYFTFNVALGQTRAGCILEVVCANLKAANSTPVLRFRQLLRSLCLPRRLVQKFESKQTWRVSKLMVSGALWCHGAKHQQAVPGAVLSWRYFAHNSWLTTWKLPVSNTSESKCVQSQMRRGEVSSLLVRAWVEADPVFPMRPCQFYPLPLLPPFLPPSSSPSSPSSCSTWHLWTPLHSLIMLRKILSSL